MCYSGAMDDLANLFLSGVVIFVTSMLISGVMGVIFVINAVKQKKHLKNTLGTNLLAIVVASVLLGLVFYFGGGELKYFLLFFLPFISIIALIGLELLGFVNKNK